MNEYVAIKRGDTIPHNTLSDLHHFGPETPLQSYVHLDWLLGRTGVLDQVHRRLQEAHIRFVSAPYELVRPQRAKDQRRRTWGGSP